MPSKYKLTYFNLRARAELARLIFAAAGVEYEDVRLEKSRWPDVKSSTPFGQVPLLQFEDLTLCQSKTIARYLANKFGLAGASDAEKLQADMIVDCLGDILGATMAMFHETDKDKQATMKQTFETEQLPVYLIAVEKLLVSNKGGDGYFVGSALSWADLAYLDLCTWLEAIETAPRYDNVPKLKGLKQRVESQPKVAEWIKNRPVTPI